MVLNYIWIGFLTIAFIVGCIRFVAFGDASVLPDMMNATFDSAKSGFTISLGLTGVLALWLGIMKIGEKGGAIQAFSKIVAPFFSKIFPDIPKNHPASGSIFMNIAANMLGLDNAATPLGLKAMKELQEINPKKDEASNPMIMFLVLNTSGLTIIPIGVMVYRAQMGAANPADVFLPILIATFLSSLAGLIAVSIYQRINLFNKVIIGVLGTMCALIAGLFVGIRHLSQEQLTTYSTLTSSFILLGIIVTFVLTAAVKRINVYEAFIDGAKDGFKVAVDVIPYLIAILVAVGVFRASGAMDFLIEGMARFFAWIGINTHYETLKRKWCPRTHGRCYAAIWSRLLCRKIGLHYTRFNRHYILHTCCLFWFCRNQEDTLCPHLRINCRSNWHHRRHYHCLHIFSLNKPIILKYDSVLQRHHSNARNQTKRSPYMAQISSGRLWKENRRH